MSSNKQRTILVLGGYGSAGKPIVDLLAKETKRVNLIIAGRSLQKAEQLVAQIDDSRVTARQVDASSPESLADAFQNMDMVVVAASTNRYTSLIMEAALKAKIDYFDININDKTRAESVASLRPQIEASNQCFVMEGGYHPGIPGALVRLAAQECSGLQSANIYTFINPKWDDLDMSPGTREEFFEELTEMDSRVYENGKWTPQGWSVHRDYDFGGVFQTQYCVPVYMEELRVLPDQIASLEEVGMYIAGFNNVTNMLVMPLAMLCLYLFPKLAKRSMERLFYWSLCRFTNPPFGAVMALEGIGRENRTISIRLAHQDAYLFTAIPAVACLLQVLDGSQRKTGLHRQAHLVEPKRFLADMKRMGLDVSVDTDEGGSK